MFFFLYFTFILYFNTISINDFLLYEIYKFETLIAWICDFGNNKKNCMNLWQFWFFLVDKRKRNNKRRKQQQKEEPYSLKWGTRMASEHSQSPSALGREVATMNLAAWLAPSLAKTSALPLSSLKVWRSSTTQSRRSRSWIPAMAAASRWKGRIGALAS